MQFIRRKRNRSVSGINSKSHYVVTYFPVYTKEFRKIECDFAFFFKLIFSIFMIIPKIVDFFRFW